MNSRGQNRFLTGSIASFGNISALLCCIAILTGCAERPPKTPTSQMDADERFWVRVLLLDDIKECSLSVRSPFSVINAQTQTTEAHFGELPTSTAVTLSAGRITVGTLAFAADRLIISPDEPHIFRLDGRDYRGKLMLVTNQDTRSFDAINLVPLEPYLAGVVGAEMPQYWEQAALEAQAVAARTYCLYIKRRFGPKRAWDVRATQANQVYNGIAAESAQIWNAVNATFGRVLECRHPDKKTSIFPAYYSSSCGGHTEDSSNVFGDSFEALRGVPCPHCRQVARPSVFFWKTVYFDKATVTSRLLKKYPNLDRLGKITKIVPVAKSDHGSFTRLTRIKLLGSTGKRDSLRAEDLRLTIDPSGRKIKSTNCTIVDMGDKWAFLDGRGFGHGVGMCQCGAQALARKAKNAEQILEYYYPDAKIKYIY